MKETDESRNQRFQDAATIHNLILVSVSPRRSIVVRVDHSAGLGPTPLNGSGYCLRQGHVVFLPLCRTQIATITCRGTLRRFVTT